MRDEGRKEALMGATFCARGDYGDGRILLGMKRVKEEGCLFVRCASGWYFLRRKGSRGAGSERTV